MLRDLRFACRLAWRERSFSAAVVLVLALGIGVNATGFSIVNAAFLRDPPFESSRELYVLSWRFPAGGESDVSYPDYQEWQAQTRTFTGMAAFRGATFTIADDTAPPRDVRGARMTGSAFAVLNEQPILGRGFVDGDDRQGAEPVTILSASLWRSRYAADPGVIGRSLRVNGQPSTIVGVMREGLQFPENAELWVPFIPAPDEAQRGEPVLTVLGRVTGDRRAAQAELDAIGAAQLAARPDASARIDGMRIGMQTLTEAFVGGPAARMLIAIMIAAGLVLLIACANVAHLILSRARTRAREIAMRMSIGATRWRVVRQLTVESLVLALAGGAGGLWMAAIGVRAFEAAMADSGKPNWLVFTLDYTVFAYVAIVCVLTAAGASLVPALLVSGRPVDTLREGSRGSLGGRSVRRFSGSLIVAELALSFILLAGGGLVARSFMKLYSLDLGISTNQLSVVGMRLRDEAFATADARRSFADRFQSRVAAIAGIDAAALTTGVPPLDGGERVLEIEPTPGAVSRERRFVSTVTVTPSFFEAVGVAMLRGRGFSLLDGTPGSEVVVINERLATQYFAGENPIGRRLRFTTRTPVPGAAPDVWRTIVGVGPTIRQGDASDGYLNAAVYLPFRQEAPQTFSLIVRSALDPAAIMAAVAREAQALDPDQPVLAIQTMEQALAYNRRFHRVFGGVFAFLAGVALVLATMGLYAVMAYSVTQRTQEIGVRVAVGAQPRQVSWLILRTGLARLAMGLAIGIAGASVLSGAVRVLLVDMTATDPVTFGAIALLLSGSALAACVMPVRRALRVDPIVALRAE
jgi:predicted permease